METMETLDLQPQLPKGIAPKLLVAQVRNTAPFLLDSAEKEAPFVEFLKAAEQGSEEFDHASYFRLCVSAHWATVATFVPTDVDVHIRQKLWQGGLPNSTLLKMVETTLESLTWPVEGVTTRWVRSPATGELVCGHQGEWFSIAVAAYGALKRREPQAAGELAEAILREMHREAQIYEDCKKARDKIALLKAATVLAHNLGDLDRVMDAWNISDDDPLKTRAYKAGHQPSALFGSTLFEAGEVNKQWMAIENHRHYQLRAPRALRRNRDLLLPISPFLDQWGSLIARHPSLKPEEVGEVAEALIIGWEKTPGSFGYPRALRGIEENFPGGQRALLDYLPASKGRILKAGPLRSLCIIPRERFEKQFAQGALHQV